MESRPEIEVPLHEIVPPAVPEKTGEQKGSDFAKGCLAVMAKFALFVVMAFIIMTLAGTTWWYHRCYENQVQETARVEEAWQKKYADLEAAVATKGDSFDKAAVAARRAATTTKNTIQTIKDDAVKAKDVVKDLWQRGKELIKK